MARAAALSLTLALGLATAPGALAAAAHPASAQPQACGLISETIDATLKDMGSLRAEADAPDDSAPRATMRAARLQALMETVQTNLLLGSLHHCPPPAVPADPDLYLNAALACRQAMAREIQGAAPKDSAEAACDEAHWQVGPRWRGAAGSL